MSKEDLVGCKVSLVTGAASGLGKAIAARFAEDGYAVVAADVDAAGLQAAARDIGDRLIPFEMDVTSQADWERVAAMVDEKFGRLDCLINNAGVTTVGSIEDLSPEAFRHEFDVDLMSVFLGCKAAIPLMKKNGGSIINMSSAASIKPDGRYAGYCTIKAGVTMLTKTVALHCGRAGYGIRCNSIHPGTIRTPILEKVLSQVDDPDETYGQWVADHPIGRLGMPEEVAALAAFLASDEAGFATGSQFSLDGGMTL